MTGLNLPIWRATVGEALGRRVVLWGLLASGLYLGLFGLAFFLLFREIAGEGINDAVQTIAAGGILTVLGLFGVSFLSSFLAMTLAAPAVSAEIDSGLTQAVAVRPLTRTTWYLQRWLGLATMSGGYVVAMGAAVLLIARIISGYEPVSAWKLLGLMLAQTWFLLTVGMLLSVKLGAMAAGVVQFCYFGISWLGGFIGFIGSVMQRDSLQNTATAVSLVVPSDGLWRAASSFAAPRGINVSALSGGAGGNLPFASFSPPSMAFLIWAAFYGLFALLGGVLLYRRRDL